MHDLPAHPALAPPAAFGMFAPLTGGTTEHVTVRSLALAEPTLPDLRRVVTPLLADAWETVLRQHNLYMEFHDVPDGIRHGFDLGVRHPITFTYISPNHKSALDNPLAVDLYIRTELDAGRYSGPFTSDMCQSRIGHFRTSPLGAIPKGDGFRIIQDFSFESSEMPSVNSDIDSDQFPCEWGSFLQMSTLVTHAPAGSEGATLDVDAAFRRCPVRPEQQNYFVVHWNGLCYIDHCVAFGGASACGIFGRVADAFVAICRRSALAPCIKWVDDFVFIRSPDEDSGNFNFDLADVIELGRTLGLPWKDTKTRPFAPTFAYVGFEWSLPLRTVEIPLAKKTKYLKRLSPWSQPGARVGRKDIDKLLGTLVHCSLAVPDGRSRLVALTRLASAFDSAKSKFS
jgi:hypothetical protein